MSSTYTQSDWHTSEQARDIPDNVKSTVVSMWKNFANVSTVMRTAGALTVIASTSAFLLQEWSIGSDLYRFYLLLGQTLILVLSGLVVAFMFKENKGARVFLGLSLVSITANMTTLGALIFSQVQWGGSIAHYPSLASWTMVDAGAMGISALSAFLLLIPTSIFSYLVLARDSAKQLTIAFLLANICLLVPVRDSMFVGLLVAIAALAPFFTLRSVIRNPINLRTLEGRLAVFSVFLPLAIIVFRHIWLYQADGLFQVAIAALTFISMRQLLAVCTDLPKLKVAINLALVFISAWVALAFTSLLWQVLSFDIILSVFSIVFAVLVVDVAKHSERLQGFCIYVAASVLIVCHIAQALAFSSMLNDIMCVIVGFAIFISGPLFEKKLLPIAGAMLIAFGVYHIFHDVFFRIDFANWMTLAVMGISTIIIASLLERYGTVLQMKYKQLMAKKVES